MKAVQCHPLTGGTIFFINAVLWILRTGAPWRDLPADYGDWKNAHRRFCRWRDSGKWETLLEYFVDQPDFKWLLLDASHCKVHPDAAGARSGNPGMNRTEGDSTPRYIWPRMRMVYRSESLLQKVPKWIACQHQLRQELGFLLGSGSNPLSKCCGSMSHDDTI